MCTPEDIQNGGYTREENATKRKQGEFWVEAPKKINEEKEEKINAKREEKAPSTGATYDAERGDTFHVGKGAD